MNRNIMGTVVHMSYSSFVTYWRQHWRENYFTAG